MASKGTKKIIYNELKKHREGKHDFFKAMFHLHEPQKSAFFKTKKTKPYGY